VAVENHAADGAQIFNYSLAMHRQSAVVMARQVISGISPIYARLLRQMAIYLRIHVL
jgi:hypothetical protein